MYVSAFSSLDNNFLVTTLLLPQFIASLDLDQLNKFIFVFQGEVEWMVLVPYLN